MNLSSVIYVQLRMIAGIAYIGGFDPTDDAERTMAYVSHRCVDPARERLPTAAEKYNVMLDQFCK